MKNLLQAEIKRGNMYYAMLADYKRHLQGMDSIKALMMGRKGLVNGFIREFSDWRRTEYSVEYTQASLDMLRKDLEAIVIDVYGPDL